MTPFALCVQCLSCQFWSRKEDATLRNLVLRFGAKKWSILAKRLGPSSRTGKQCRERWHNHLKTGVNKAPWTSDEDEIIFEEHRLLVRVHLYNCMVLGFQFMYVSYTYYSFQQGNQWVLVAKALQGRTVTQVKNRFYSTKRKQERLANQPNTPVKDEKHEEHDNSDDDADSTEPERESCQTLKLKLLFAQKALLEHVEKRADQSGLQVCAGSTGITLELTAETERMSSF